MNRLTTCHRLVVGGVLTLVAGAAQAGPYDSWWACVKKCCDECASCVDGCTKDFNSGQGGSGQEWPRFDLTLGYEPGSETLVYAPGEELLLRVERWRGAAAEEGPGKVEFVRFYAISRRAAGSAPEFFAVPWERVGSGEYDTAESAWSVPMSTADFSDPSGYYLRADFVYPDGSTSTGVTAAVVAAECPADCDGDGKLSIRDFICFQSLFARADNAADCTGDGKLNINDFICFHAQFHAGCP